MRWLLWSIRWQRSSHPYRHRRLRGLRSDRLLYPLYLHERLPRRPKGKGNDVRAEGVYAGLAVEEYGGAG